ncbi:hypothetical protein ANN_11347 [Periplaneta americana]|uniref:PAS domain-containing protein n=1 Tax=Periplaneta americana TaxID=6978 RepID=A0ABQ8T4S2_PERAM|nr:hypothetical protein ANN_11347 [Periplaneta americana]
MAGSCEGGNELPGSLKASKVDDRSEDHRARNYTYLSSILSALSGFLMMMTQNGKLLYISDNAAEYLGHSMYSLFHFSTHDNSKVFRMKYYPWTTNGKGSAELTLRYKSGERVEQEEALDSSKSKLMDICSMKLSRGDIGA